MRVTDSMIANRVVFNMQRSLERFLNLQTQASSGRRINKPSDDPLGIQRDLGYRSEIAKTSQLQKNISQGQNWMFAYDSIQAELKNFVQTAKEVAITMANGTYDAVAREGAANEISSIFEQIMQLGNTEKEGKHIFAGFQTDAKPLRATGNGVVYEGDFGRIEFQIDSAARLPINLNGSEAFLRPFMSLGEGHDLNIGLTGDTLLADLHNGQGVDTSASTFTITDENLGITSTVDISGAATVDDVLTAINTQLAADGITNLTAGVAQSGNNIVLNATPNPKVSIATPIDNLNQGHGIDMTLGEINLSNASGLDMNIDFTGSQTLGDVIIAFNTQLIDAGINNVTLQITSEKALKIEDTNVPPLDLVVSEVDPASKTGLDLGILGNVGSLLVGGDLDPKLGFSVGETTGQVATDLGLIGSFSANLAGTDLDPRLTADDAVADLNVRSGFNLGPVIIWQGESTRTIDLSDPSIATMQDMLDAFNNSGLDITATIGASGRGIEIANNDSTRSLIIEDLGSGSAAKELGIYGSTDMMGTVIALENALRNNDQTGAELLLKGLDESIQLLLNNRATVGARAIRLESTNNRLTDLGLSLTKSLSEVEDADITKVLTDLATFETNYQSSLMATAKIIQPSLLDFLR